MTRRRIGWLLAALTLLAFAVRFFAIIDLHAWKMPAPLEHRQIALNLLAGFGFSVRDWSFFGPSSVQGPIYPLILAGFFKWLGPDTDGAYAMAMVFNALVGAACVPLLYQMIRTIGGSIRLALIAAGMLAIWPTQIYAVTYAQPVVLIAAIVIVLITLFYRALASERLLTWSAFSVLAMIAVLLEPVLLWAMLITLIGLCFIRALSFPTRLQFAGILLACAFLIVGPWTMRNYVVHRAFMPVTSNFWTSFWTGNNPHATGTDRLPMSSQQVAELEAGMTEAQRRDSRFDSSRQFNLLSPQQRERLNHQPEAVRELIFKQWATQWVSAHPLDYARLCILRLGKTLWADMDNPKSQSVYTISRAILLLLSIWGAAIAIRARSLRIFPTMLFVVPVTYYTLTLTGARFALPYEPLQIGAAAIAVAALARRIMPARDPKLSRSSAIVREPLLALDDQDVQPHHA